MLIIMIGLRSPSPGLKRVQDLHTQHFLWLPVFTLILSKSYLYLYLYLYLYMIAQIWNQVPTDTKSSSTLAQFRARQCVNCI